MSYGERKCKQCNEVFEKKTPLQYLCSPKCQMEYSNKGKVKKKSIAPVSSKRLKQLAEYREKRKEFLSRLENRFCPVVKHLHGTYVQTTEIHHTNGREGERLNDEEYWLAVSRQGHTWIHGNPKQARELGFLI